MAPIALVVSLAGGWFLAGRALRPVDSITVAAQRIAAGDLTQRLTSERSSDEIGRLTDTFNDMIARLETSFAQIRQFSSDASHELRTPLTVMKGESELVLRRPRPVEDYIAVLESNLEEIDRMSRIVEELLFLSRADLGQIKTECEPVRLDLLLEDIQRQAGLLDQEREVDVVIETIQPATVQGDELRLRELILNIVDNAVKYSYAQGTVEIDLRVEGQRARLSVRDHGIGIPPRRAQTNFRPLLSNRRRARPHQERHRARLSDLCLDCGVAPWTYRSPKRSRQGLDLHHCASTGATSS